MATPRRLNIALSRDSTTSLAMPAATAMATTPGFSHRSATVQKISAQSAQVLGSSSNNTGSGRNLALAQLWSQCASPVSYTSSLATAAIVDLVSTKNAVDWTDALEGFENALATAQGSSAIVNMVHALSSLIITAADISASGPSQPKPNTTVNKNVFGIKNHRHPFIALIATESLQVEPVLFAEMDKILDHRPDSAQYRIAAFGILTPFLDYVLLDRDGRMTIAATAVVVWIVKTLNASLFDPDQEPLVIHLFNYLCSIPDRFALDRSRLSTTLHATVNSLVDLYCLPSTQASLSSDYKNSLGGRLLMLLLSWIADMRRFGLATLPMMQSVQSLFRNRKGYVAPTLPFDTLWPQLSCLLMNSPTVEEQRVVVDWMYAVISGTQEPVNAMIAHLAFLPIFQVLGESQSEITTKKCSEMLTKLEVLPRSAAPHVASEVNVGLSATTGMSAMIQAEIMHLRGVWVALDDESLLTLGDDRTLSSLIYSTLMFHPDDDKRINAITQQAQVEDGRLVTLVLFIYLLRVDPSARVKLHLLQEAIPSLVTDKDEVVTARILRTVLTLINSVPNAPTGSKFVHSHMGAVGVRILFMIWKRQPRVWKTLRHVIHGWVESRPRLLRTPQKGDAEYDMEVAVLTTIRDICAFDAAGYAEVLIPFLATLLGSVEMYASSTCTIIETMNITVDANVVEPRAAWNVLLCHVAEHAMKAEHAGMLQEMCVFYGIVGSRSEDTQVYLDLREAILTNYIQPLLASQNPEVLAAALKALSYFTAPEIMSVLPTESPSLYIRESILEAQDALVVDEFSLVLDKLVRHELQHMRRGLFKDAAFKRTVPDSGSGVQELSRLQGVLTVVSGNILQKWQSGDVNPGLRTGYALSSLLCSAVVEKLPASSSKYTITDTLEADDSVEAIQGRQSYRNVMTALTDVTLTDHLVERISALEGWTALFDNMWITSDDSQTSVIAETLIGDLYKKITDGYIPAHCANALFAITGTALTVSASVLAKHLLQNFVRPETLSDIGSADEVQFAVLVSLSFITPLVVVDEKLVAAVLDVFVDRLQADAGNNNTSSELSSWATFAGGWALCNLLAGLVDAPTKTAELDQLCRQTLQQLLTVLDLGTASFALMLGILIAFPRLSDAISSSTSQARKHGAMSEEAEAVQRIKTMARDDLEAFLENAQQAFSAQGLARLLGAPWVIAFSDRTDASQEDRKADLELLDRTLLAATARRDLQPQLVHFTVPFCQIIHTNLDVRNPASSEISLFTGRIHSLVNLIRITPTSAARHTAVVALACLFGVDWCRGPNVASVGSHGLFSYLTASAGPAAMASVTDSALTTLLELSGLSISITTTTTATTVGENPGAASPAAHAIVLPGSRAPSAKSALMIQDLKAGRLAAMTLGHIASLIYRLGQTDTGKVVGTSSEPKDYSRLPVSTSWLRALWDGLWEPLQMGSAQRAQKSYTAALELLLYAVHSLPTPLPAVNWFPLLTQLITLDPRLVVPVIHVSSRHATTSTSLMEILIMSLSSFKIGDTAQPDESSDDARFSAEELLVGEEGLGRILTLGGLPLIAVGGDQALAELDKVRGLEGLAKRVTLPSSRVVDLVEKIVKILFFDRQGVQMAESRAKDLKAVEVLQLLFLDTLSNHMRLYRQGRSSSANKSGQPEALSTTAQEMLGELRAVMLKVFYRVSFPEFMIAQRVLRRLADLSLMSISHLDAAQLDNDSPLSLSLSMERRADAGARVLKQAVGIASLYRAGYLTSQQEGRLTQIAQSALLIASSEDDSYGENVSLAESAISVLLHAMNTGACGDRSFMTSTLQQRKKASALKMTWLQRILDLLVLVSSQPRVFARGLVLLLGGAVLLWWDGDDIAILGAGSFKDQVSDSSARPAVVVDDAESNLLAMADDHDFEQHDSHSGGGVVFDVDFNLQEDDEFEQWHQQFLESIATKAIGAGGSAENVEAYHRMAVLSRVSLILPDIVMSVRGGSSGSVASSSFSSSDTQTANRLLRLALDPQIQVTEKQFLIRLLRRMEELVPKGQAWLLK
ncbi:hypothetical protein BGZ99_007032 [Dissophora globulifera]|uniref:DUF3730 domain-containing protein n=1 Tax=Dissophora globulifera TaxID=979702 RepID=A0A9P6URJ3_9FUNG|nr:hypothetical protein BGZ99_007032 [Dissophora globulifera]